MRLGVSVIASKIGAPQGTLRGACLITGAEIPDVNTTSVVMIGAQTSGVEASILGEAASVP